VLLRTTHPLISHSTGAVSPIDGRVQTLKTNELLRSSVNKKVFIAYPKDRPKPPREI